MSNFPALERKLGLTDAIMIGLGSMIGAGIFAAFAPAAAAAGAGLLVGLGIAAVIAYCNATSSAQLAAQYPTSGGTYVYGRERLGQWPGFLAGWSFVIGKTASCAAMALTCAAYLAPTGWEKPVAVVAVLGLTAVNYFGVTRTAQLTKIIVIAVLCVLAGVIVLGLGSGPVTNGADSDLLATFGAGSMFEHGWTGILQSAGLLFFAFAGYARIATMGEEVKEPRVAIPRAILTSLGVALVLYVAIAATALWALGPDALATSSAPLADMVAHVPWAVPVVKAGAGLAALGALLALITGIGRTSLAMARNGDLPRWLAEVHPKYAVPHRAELVLGIVVCVLVVSVDLRGAIGFSSFGVLLYYLVANVAAWTQSPGHRRYPRVLQIVGAIGCLALTIFLPATSVAIGVVVLVVGSCLRLVALRQRSLQA